MSKSQLYVTNVLDEFRCQKHGDVASCENQRITHDQTKAMFTAMFIVRGRTLWVPEH